MKRLSYEKFNEIVKEYGELLKESNRDDYFFALGYKKLAAEVELWFNDFQEKFYAVAGRLIIHYEDCDLLNFEVVDSQPKSLYSRRLLIEYSETREILLSESTVKTILDQFEINAIIGAYQMLEFFEDRCSPPFCNSVGTLMNDIYLENTEDELFALAVQEIDTQLTIFRVNAQEYENRKLKESGFFDG